MSKENKTQKKNHWECLYFIGQKERQAQQDLVWAMARLEGEKAALIPHGPKEQEIMALGGEF